MATPTKRIGRTIAVALLALLAVLSATDTMRAVQALPFSGSPIIGYNEPFYVYAAQWNSYCTSNQAFLSCNVNVTDQAQASRFYIAGGCGPVVASLNATTAFALSPNDGNNWFWLLPHPPDDVRTLLCGYIEPKYQFAFSNYVPAADGLLHGGVTQVQWNVPGDGWCSAQPVTSNSGHVQCNRDTVSAWEAFYFVPA